jgi:hypothetical protein
MAKPPGQETPLSRRRARAGLLADKAFVKHLVELRHPKKESHWYEAPGLIAVLSAAVTALLTYIVGCYDKRDEQRMESRQARMVNVASTVGQMSTLVSGLLLAAEDRTEIAKGAYAKFTVAELNPMVDTTNAMDLRWRLGRQQLELYLRFHFADDPGINRAWSSARVSLQKYSDCAELAFKEYWDDTTKKATPDACLKRREGSLVALDTLNTELIRGFGELGKF